LQALRRASNESLCAGVLFFVSFSGETGTLSHRASDEEETIWMFRLD
jgi:hypothetical protein